MSTTPEELKYTKTHEWVRTESNGEVTVGITQHAQDLLGDMVFIELPDVGTNFGTGEDCAVVESVKAASDVYCPVAGEITAVNEALTDAPETVNKDPFGDGWLFRLKPEDAQEADELMDAAAYQELADSEQH
ncbi:MAG: glycine cleavage system protein GcvH [Gammaproteobacteria bacterium]|nr:glycine cleavage system protein GcvH [Gammaproteobacteria bacterium]MDH5802060.1 glycine cleavage system protein GcvH [Gammaproteobacteria bacterium]